MQEMILLQFCPLADSLSLWQADTYLAAVVIILEFSPKMWLGCWNLDKYAALMLW